MRKPSGSSKRNRLLVVAGTLILVPICYLLADPERNQYFNAMALLLSITGVALAKLTLHSDRSISAGPRIPLKQLTEQLAERVKPGIYKEIKSLGLSGSDYIQVEWAADLDFVISKEVRPIKSRIRDVSTLGEDWLATRPGLTVVLGPKGAGKSSAAMILAHQILDQDISTDHDQPIPVLFQLGGWNPEQSLAEWVGLQLEDIHGIPYLDQDGNPGSAFRLLAQGALVLILDGFDEIPKQRRHRAFEQIRDAMEIHRSPIVMTSRIDEFYEATKTVSLAAIRMSVVTLRPISPNKAQVYLERIATSDHWSDLFSLIRQKNSPLAEALSTPLMLYLCGEVYRNSRPEVHKLQEFTSIQSFERHLIAWFLPLRYKGSDAATAIAFLRFIAVQMQHVDNSIFQWWNLHSTLRRSIFFSSCILAGALVFGTTFMLARADERFGFVFGSSIGLVAAIRATKPDVPTRLVFRFRTLFLGLVSALLSAMLIFLVTTGIYGLWVNHFGLGELVLLICAIGILVLIFSLVFDYAGFDIRHSLIASAKCLMLGLAVGLMSGVGFAIATLLSGNPMNGALGGISSGLSFGLVFSLILITALALVVGISAPQTSTRLGMLGPREVFNGARKVAWMNALGTGIIFFVAFGFVSQPVAPFPANLRLSLAFGLAGCILGITLLANSWFSYHFAHIIIVLTSRGKIPLRFFSFLNGAYKRGILRQVGAAYEFRHAALQSYLLNTKDQDHERQNS